MVTGAAKEQKSHRPVTLPPSAYRAVADAAAAPAAAAAAAAGVAAAATSLPFRGTRLVAETGQIPLPVTHMHQLSPLQKKPLVLEAARESSTSL